MQSLLRPLQTQRIIAIDAFRAITFLVMIFVNELAGVSNISAWLKHMPADADAMSFPDIVFPAFLFIVGMSIPISINQRLQKGDHFLQLNQHIALRALGLIVMGLFMVNAESGYAAQQMSISIEVWSLLSYLGFAAIWGVYTFSSITLTYGVRLCGIVILLTLSLLYRSDSPSAVGNGMQIQWWGILGLIGWAYLFSCWIYQVCGGRQSKLLLAIVACTLVYLVLHSDVTWLQLTHGTLSLLPAIDAHFSHSAIVLCGILCSLIFFEEGRQKRPAQRFMIALLFAAGLIAVATMLRPYFKISKIAATPSWCFYSAAICMLVFGLLYWLIDIQQRKTWVTAIDAVAINPLVCYLLPFVIGACLHLVQLPSPVQLFTGLAGMTAAMLYTMMIVVLVAALNKANFKIKF